jgi:Kdo2-lipid IVA lauroyltransferase/acyltransferase
MKKSPLLYVIKTLTLPMQLLPLRAHYPLSDFIFLFVYHIFRYRRNVVDENLSLAFPEKTEIERQKIARKFYHNFCDTFIETLYIQHIREEEYFKRVRFENIELLTDVLNRGQSVIGITAHTGNWEYSQSVARFFQNTFFVYKKLNNKAFDQLFLDLRCKTGAKPLEMRETFRQLKQEHDAKRTFLGAFLADQRPPANELNHWIPFFGIDTPVIIGPEKIASKFQCAVIWAQLIREKRGYYRIRFEIITENARNNEPLEVTRIMFSKLEETLKMYPDQWLWTHKRWKYKRV